MLNKLPENIDHLEDFYRAGLSQDVEMPSPDLWEKVSRQIHNPPVSGKGGGGFLKKNWMFFAIGILAVTAVGHYQYQLSDNSISDKDIADHAGITDSAEHFRPNSDRNQGSESQLSDTASLYQKDYTLSAPQTENIAPEEHVAPVLPPSTIPPLPNDEAEPDFFESKTSKTPSLPQQEEEQVIPVAEEEPADLYSRLKKEHKKDSVRHLFIEKTK